MHRQLQTILWLVVVQFFLAALMATVWHYTQSAFTMWVCGWVCGLGFCSFMDWNSLRRRLKDVED